MDSLELKPIRRAAGKVRLPGSKSISNRVLLLAALASGDTEVSGLLDADDTRVMRDALSKLGVRFSKRRVRGVGGPFPVKRAELFLGNAGTALRPLTAALVMTGGEYRLSGAPRMNERPIGDLVNALRGIGADVEYLGADGYPPLALHPATIKLNEPVTVKGDVSSQFLTALLMALPLHSFEVPAARYVSPGKIYVEGDASSASYFLAAGAIGGGPVRVEGVGRDSIQGDVRFTEVLERMGARVSMGEGWIEAAGGKKLKAVDMDLNHIPDAAMTAAVMALFADGPSTLRNIGSWRVKETDRLAAMATELRKLGARVEEGRDSLRISPGKLKPAVIDTYDDHRMAMSFSLAALGGVPVRINDPGCVAKTFPEYFSAFASIAAA